MRRPYYQSTLLKYLASMSHTQEDYTADAAIEAKGMLDDFDKAAHERNFKKMADIISYYYSSMKMGDSGAESIIDSLQARFNDIREEEKWLIEEQAI